MVLLSFAGWLPDACEDSEHDDSGSEDTGGVGGEDGGVEESVVVDDHPGDDLSADGEYDGLDGAEFGEEEDVAAESDDAERPADEHPWWLVCEFAEFWQGAHAERRDE